MTTLVQLADRAQNAISDAAAGSWSQATIEEWCNEAIRDYSLRFPRELEATQAVGALDRKYDLPARFGAMLTVEYPDGEDPPEYLTRRDHRGGGFWDYEGYYDIVNHGASAVADELWISEKPSAGETIRYWYQTDHDFALASGGTLTVPGRHEHILIAFVLWSAWRELTSGEMQSPTSSSSLLMSQMQQNEAGAWSRYRELVRVAEQKLAGQSAAIAWSEVARIY